MARPDAIADCSACCARATHRVRPYKFGKSVITESLIAASTWLFSNGFVTFVTFVTLYNMQPLLPEFARELGVSPTLSNLPLSLAMLFAGTLSETWGRKRVMTLSLFLTSILTLLTSFSHDLKHGHRKLFYSL